jgi:hypothetical protein
MEHSHSWKAKSHSVSEEIPRVSWLPRSQEPVIPRPCVTIRNETDF